MRSLLGYTTFLLTLSSCASYSVFSDKNSKHTDKSILNDSVEVTQQGIKKPRIKVSEDPIRHEILNSSESIDDSELLSSTAKKRPVELISNKKGASELDEKDDLNLVYEKSTYKHWVKYFTNRGKGSYFRHLTRGEKYRELISSIFEKHGLPRDLFYVGLIESGYRMHAKSVASAVGPWQFIKGTAKRYGLKVNNQVDERKNIVKATEAAAGYFKDLYNIFGSWELALCAYNAGEYRIINAIRRGNTRDYVELVKRKLIPKETIYYVPKVAAARMLSKKRRNYDIKVKAVRNSKFARAREVKVSQNVNLRDLAKKLRVPYSSIKDLNPDYHTRWISASRRRPARLVVPSNRVSSVGRHFNTKSTKRVTFASASASKNNKTYKVRRGDNLSNIAKRSNISLSDLKRLNKIRGSKIFVGQKLKVTSTKVRSIARVKSKKVNYYKVKSGDNLSKISKRVGVSVSQIKSLNHLRSGRIYPGQSLKVRKSNTAKKSKSYVVRRGDNLFKLARKFGTSVRTIISYNKLKTKTIYRGQRIRIPSNG